MKKRNTPALALLKIFLSVMFVRVNNNINSHAEFLSEFHAINEYFRTHFLIYFV